MSTGFYVRHQGSCGGTIFDPLTNGHPLLEIDCVACLRRFEVGDRTVLVPIGPGGDFEAAAKALSGGWYNAVSVPVHAACAGQADELPAPVPDQNIV